MLKNYRTPIHWFIPIFILCSNIIPISIAADIQLAWDAVLDNRLAYYEVHQGTASQIYNTKSTTTETTKLISGLSSGQQYYFAVKACDQYGTECSPFSNEVNTTIPNTQIPLSITSETLPTGIQNTNYTTTLIAVGGTKPYSWSIQSGSLPTGLVLNTSTGTISGIPMTQTISNFIVKVQDSSSVIAINSKSLTLTIDATSTNSTLWANNTIPILVDGGPDNSVELGFKFRSDVGGTITGIRFYKSNTNSGTHIGNLWSNTGTNLATVTFTNETYSGWQQMNFPKPVAINPNTIYIASYHANNGHYSIDVDGFLTGIDNPPLHALANGESGGNGVYAYGSIPAFPNQTWYASNYWVDVVFTPSVLPDEPDIPMEIGELLVDNKWQWVNFQLSYTTPIVVANPLSNNDIAPALIRIYGINNKGFWIKVQEWDYLDGKHLPETISYMVMEKGNYQLPNGTMIEAGRLNKGTTTFTTINFNKVFNQLPVVFSTATSNNEVDAISIRNRSISKIGFQTRIQEQESNRQKHLPESIDYIAWEPSYGIINNLHYEVGNITNGVTSKGKTLIYQSEFIQPPKLISDIQTTNGSDPSNLRWKNKTEIGVDIWIAEEQSKDLEMDHATESVGYIAIE